ncbi:hypothetical protein DsansV1_C37g0232471 [Dioscorea sansibarensis]
MVDWKGINYCNSKIISMNFCAIVSVVYIWLIGKWYLYSLYEVKRNRSSCNAISCGIHFFNGKCCLLS